MYVLDIKTNDLVVKIASSRTGLDDLLAAVKKLNNKGCVVQLFNPASVVNRMHIVGAYANASVVFDNNTNRTNSLAMEMLLFAAMTNQIGDAIEIAGAKSASEFIIFASSKSLFNKLSPLLTKQKEFAPSKQQITILSKSLGLKGPDYDSAILEKMAL